MLREIVYINVSIVPYTRVTLTILLRVFIGLVNVSLMRLAGGFLGLVEGMCTAQHLINNPINMMKAIPINSTAHQHS